jgi:Iron-sulfur cluster-binding domain
MPTLEITTHLGCALACRFCPQDRLVKSYPKGEPRDLSLPDFIRIVDRVPAHVRLDFSGMAEPWLNPWATDMAVHAFERGRKVAIYTTLQGMAAEDADQLIRRFGDRISPETPWVIHLPDGEGHMTGWRPSPAYRATLSRFLAFQRDRPDAGLAMMTMSADGSVAEPLRDLIPDRLTPFVGISRAENLDRAEFTPSALLAYVRHEGAVLCASTPFFDHNAMLPNGDVVLCCMDYGRRHVVGNLLRQSYEEIHAGPAMGAIRVQAMTPADGDLLCRGCHNAVCLTQDGGTHWRLSGATMWTPAGVSHPAPPPPPTRRRFGFLGRVLHL